MRKISVGRFTPSDLIVKHSTRQYIYIYINMLYIFRINDGRVLSMSLLLGQKREFNLKI